MIRLTALSALLFAAACATSAPYGPATKSGGQGYTVQQIESDRFRVSYTDRDEASARSRALRRAAEISSEQGADWFQLVSAYEDKELSGGSGSSIGIGAGGGSGGRTSVGVGVGISLPLGGSSGPTTHVLEIVTGTGVTPEDAAIYNVDEVLANTAIETAG